MYKQESKHMDRRLKAELELCAVMDCPCPVVCRVWQQWQGHLPAVVPSGTDHVSVSTCESNIS